MWKKDHAKILLTCSDFFLVKCAEAELEIRESIEDNLKIIFTCRACPTAYSDRSNLLCFLRILILICQQKHIL